jgi:hypothetical protein
MRLTHILLTAGALALPMAPAAAQVIFAPIAGVVNVGGPGNGNLADTWNQNGLLTGYTANVTNFNTYLAGNPQHNLAFAGNEWFSDQGINGATVTYDFGSSKSFDRLALWNEDASGIGLLTLSVSSDNVNFTAFATNLAPTNNPVNQNYGADVFSFATQTGRYVRFEMSRCPQADNPQLFEGCAIGEVAFRAAAIPEPTTWALMIAGFGLVGSVSRRRTAGTRHATA